MMMIMMMMIMIMMIMMMIIIHYIDVCYVGSRPGMDSCEQWKRNLGQQKRNFKIHKSSWSKQ